MPGIITPQNMAFSVTYMRQLAELLESLPVAQFDAALELLRRPAASGRKVLLAGNGASAAIASHVAVDLTKVSGVRAVTFNESDLITCFANDYGYEHWIAKALEFYADAGDTVVLVSSSGRSPNVVNAARQARAMGTQVLTLSGFAPDNPLRALGHVNLWAESDRYNLVEVAHQAWLVAMVDALAESASAASM
jgi:D-sedoheptulose 7-phosphate isomerase